MGGTDLERRLTWESWANERTSARLRELGDPPPRARQLLAHVQAGLRLWLLRLDGEDSDHLPVWPDLSLAECEVSARETGAALAELRSRLTDEWLDSEITYTNQHDLSYRTAVRDVLTHLLTHGAYHRGQIALVLRDAGLEFVNTDYITWVREQAGQPWRP